MFIQGSEFDGVNLSKIKENSVEILALPKMSLYWVDKKKYQELLNNLKSVDLLVIIFFLFQFFRKFQFMKIILEKSLYVN